MDRTKVRAVIKKAGGPSKVAARIGITRQAVSGWHRVPPEHVIVVERLAGIPRQKIRPDIYPD